MTVGHYALKSIQRCHLFWRIPAFETGHGFHATRLSINSSDTVALANGQGMVSETIPLRRGMINSWPTWIRSASNPGFASTMALIETPKSAAILVNVSPRRMVIRWLGLPGAACWEARGDAIGEVDVAEGLAAENDVLTDDRAEEGALSPYSR
jgi:hypothetical protein